MLGFKAVTIPELDQQILDLLALGGMCVSQLSLELFVRPQEIRVSLVRLEGMGMVEKCPDADKEAEYSEKEVPYCLKRVRSRRSKD